MTRPVMETCWKKTYLMPSASILRVSASICAARPGWFRASSSVAGGMLARALCSTVSTPPPNVYGGMATGVAPPSGLASGIVVSLAWLVGRRHHTSGLNKWVQESGVQDGTTGIDRSGDRQRRRIRPRRSDRGGAHRGGRRGPAGGRQRRGRDSDGRAPRDARELPAHRRHRSRRRAGGGQRGGG